jgi:tRNA modification GTPase
MRAEELLARMLTSREPEDSIAVEAKLALTTVKSVEGARLVTNQIKAGLAATARRWLAELDSVPLEGIAAEAKQILRDSRIARLILSGCTIALVGPPNSGKSTLLNALAGREKAIVTDIPGTTRDWVSAQIRIPPLAATIVDTAGLDPTLAGVGETDQTAQRKSLEALNRADLILLVLDASRPAEQFSGAMAEMRVGRKTITVLNKADLPPRLEPKSLPSHLQNAVRISAKQEAGIEDLVRAVHGICGLTDFSLSTPVAFTERQRTLIERLTAADSPGEAATTLAELLHGPSM